MTGPFLYQRARRRDFDGVGGGNRLGLGRLVTRLCGKIPASLGGGELTAAVPVPRARGGLREVRLQLGETLFNRAERSGGSRAGRRPVLAGPGLRQREEGNGLAECVVEGGEDGASPRGSDHERLATIAFSKHPDPPR